MEPDIRDEIVSYFLKVKAKTDFTLNMLLKMINISSSKYYSWSSSQGMPNFHNGIIPKSNRLLDWEKEFSFMICLNHILKFPFPGEPLQ
ncbi:MAG TPA: hypothetical protein DCY06_11755 [Bacteroidetes bacterium]|nr:hypothetical protein [Bacteroidota bacterium]